MISIIFLIATILTVWFKSEAYLEYCKLFKLNRISYYKDYNNKYINDVSLTYHKYLREYHDNFFTRLVTCPICVTMWLSIILSLTTYGLTAVPMIFIGSLLLFGIVHLVTR